MAMKEKLTQKDVEKIQQEIDHRKLVVRKEAIEAVKEARAQGDLSENFEYYAAKKHKNQMLSVFFLLSIAACSFSLKSSSARSGKERVSEA